MPSSLDSVCQQHSKKRGMEDQYIKTLAFCEIILLLSLKFILPMQLVIFSCSFSLNEFTKVLYLPEYMMTHFTI